MNSVSESLFMAVPMILYPQTNEQHAVARRTVEIGAGLLLKEDSAEGIRSAVQDILQDKKYAAAAEEYSRDFRSCSGPAGAAKFIEEAPHRFQDGIDPIRKMNRKSAICNILYWVIAAAVMNLAWFVFGMRYWWLIGIAAGVLNRPFGKFIQNQMIKKIC